MELALIAGFFLFVMAGVAAGGYFLILRPSEQPPAGSIPMALQEPTVDGAPGVFIGVLRTLGESVPIRQADRDEVRQKLAYAGYRWPSALTVFYGAKCGIGFLLAGLFGVTALNTQEDAFFALVGAFCGMGLGYLVPERFLDARIRARDERLRRALPPCLDMLVMSVEAGQGLDQAMLGASRGLRKLFPDLSVELAQVHMETRASKGRGDAIRHMAERNSDSDLRKFCQLLLDADRFGASLAPTLRRHSKYLRVRFRQRAQEAARKISVKMVFPVFFLIFPSVLVVTLGPAVLLMYRQMRQFLQ
jgi:tight adherence protein C